MSYHFSYTVWNSWPAVEKVLTSVPYSINLYSFFFSYQGIYLLLEEFFLSSKIVVFMYCLCSLLWLFGDLNLLTCATPVGTRLPFSVVTAEQNTFNTAASQVVFHDVAGMLYYIQLEQKTVKIREEAISLIIQGNTTKIRGSKKVLGEWSVSGGCKHFCSCFTMAKMFASFYNLLL